MGSIPNRIGFLGAGKMATALARGWIQGRLLEPSAICASDPLAQARDDFTKQTTASALADNVHVLREADILVVAVKPQAIARLSSEIQPHLHPRHLVISIVAGVSLARLERELGTNRTIRVMPNTPCLVGASASAYAAGQGATAADVEVVERLLASVGRAVAVPERLLDAVTGLSGSGPAYVFLVMEALADGGVRMGLPRDVAAMLAAQTVLGAARLVLETGQHPAALKDMVASAGGTTIAGLHALEKGGLRAALIDAVQAATLRSIELGQS